MTKFTTIHGMAKTKIYVTWANMKARCLNNAHPSYHHYGRRGITVCERWLDFKNFYADMGEIPEGMTLDRIDNNGDYSLENCRWADWHEQANNRRNNKFFEFEGIKLTLKEWSEKLELNHQTLLNRLRRGWSIERAFKTRPCAASREFLGSEGVILTFSHWSKKKGISVRTLRDRLKSGWSIEKTLNTPSQRPKIF